MWKDFRNFALVFIAVFSVLSFSVSTRNKMDRNAELYDNLVAIKEKLVEEDINAWKSEKAEKERQQELVEESERQRQSALLRQKAVQTYTPPVYTPPVTIVTPKPTPVPTPIVVQPKPSRTTRAS